MANEDFDTAVESIEPVKTDTSARPEDGPQPTDEEILALLEILDEEEAE